MRPAGRAPQRARGVRQRAGAVGNPLVAAPQYSATNAITVDATPVAVWPWLVQMAAYGGRLVCVRPPRQRRRDERMGDRPELQGLKVGHVMATDRSGEGFAVEAIDPARSLVLSIRSAEAVTSSALVLEPTIDGRTRLLLRLRLRAGDSPRAGVPGDHGGRARHHDPKDAVQYQGSRRTPRGPRACSRVMGAVCVAPHHPRDRQPLKAGSYSGHCP